MPISSTGARSFWVSKPRFGISAGFTAWVSKTSTQVFPSGAARATSRVPIEPEAPPLLSTTTGTPSAALRCGCSRREMASTLPPGGKGATRRIGPAGQAGWAMAGAARTRPLASAARRVNMMRKLPVFPP